MWQRVCAKGEETMTSDLRKGDQVVIISPRVSRRGPWPVQQVDEDGQIWLNQRTRGGHRRTECFSRAALAKLELGQSLQQALIAHVPESKRCQICNFRPGSESHFFTVPIPEAFTRLCPEDRADIVQEIRLRVGTIVADVFAQAKAGQLKKTR